MTKELSMAIQLLELSTPDLHEFIKEQAMENPLIELDEMPTFSEYKSSPNHHANSSLDETTVPYTMEPENNQRDQLIEEIGILRISQDTRNILRYLVFNMEDNGYLAMSDEEFKKALSINQQTLESSLNILHSMEPIGIGARNLKECLLIQAKKLYPDNTLITNLLQNHLEDLGNQNWDKITQELQVKTDDIESALELIREMDPKPGKLINDSKINYIIPDIIIEMQNDKFTVSTNDAFMPKIKLNNAYLELSSSDSEVHEYVKEKYKQYRWLLNSVSQRNATMLKIARSIAEKQSAFLAEGFDSLNPMTQRDISTDIDMHESTISRALKNNFIQTPVGTFEIKYLFTSKLLHNDGRSISSTRVKHQLKQIIEDENKNDPYSDQFIKNYFFNKYGIDISRRTVAKYRNVLGIPSSKKRIFS